MSCYVEKVISIARNEVGYLEKRDNSQLDNMAANAGENNFTKYARDMDKISGFYNGKKQGFPWCSVFVSWIFVQAYGVENAKKLLCLPNNSLAAGCVYAMNYFKSKGQLKSSPKIGDQIFFKNSLGVISHTGLVYAVDKSYVYTIEGNTSTTSGVVANGGGVCAKKYLLSYSRIAGYGRPVYDKTISASKPVAEPIVKNAKVYEWQNAAINDGFQFKICGADGVFGSECESVAKKAIVKKRLTYKYKNLTKIVQRAVGVTVDGLCGPNTVKAIKKYQAEHNLVADGEVGLNTWKKILGVA